MISLSKMALATESSLTRKLFNMALEIGDDVINLTLGDPDLMPNEEIRKAACDAIMSGKTRYSQNAGLVELREVYADFFKKEYGVEVTPDEVISTVGGMEALFLSMAATIDPGSEVIILGPYYVNYRQMIKMCQGLPIAINRLRRSDDEVLNDIKSAITKKTVAIILNTPSNPSGDMLSGYFLDEIAKIATKNNLLVICDEVYRSLVYDNKKAESIITRPGMKDRSIIIDSVSKRFCMTGYRAGFAVGNKDIISNMVKMQENVCACTPLPSQYAAIKAYKGGFDNSVVHDIYEHRRDVLVRELDKVPNITYIYPEATFYCMVDISKSKMDSLTFSEKLLEEKHVAVVPARSYGALYDNYIRIAFTLDEEKLVLAMQRFAEFMKGF